MASSERTKRLAVPDIDAILPCTKQAVVLRRLRKSSQSALQ
jgi:hypothetical protein